MLTKNLLRMIIICLSLISIAFSFISPGEVKSAGEINIKIWVDKDLYLVREPIFVNYSIKNVTDSLLFLSFNEIEEYFVIKDQNGRLEITSAYGVKQVGEYNGSLQMPSGGFFPYTGAKSNTIKIKVKGPTGDEKKALDLYLEAQKLHWCKDKDPKKWEQAFYKYLELAGKYPKSVYAPMSLYTALFKAHVIKDKNIVISVCKKLIENYPESYYIDDTFYNLVGNYKVLEDKTGAIEYMKELIKKYPDSKISERAEYWLEKIEKWEFE
jgi:TolA-binding protein